MTTHDLTITFAPPPADSSDLATWTITFNANSASGTLPPQISDEERHEMRWYLEEYIEFPFHEFHTRGERIAHSLATIGKRLFDAIFESSVAATKIYTDWDRYSSEDRTLQIVSELPAVLSMPWELLHDEQGFLAQRKQHPVAIIRSVPNMAQGKNPLTFQLPLRVLIVVARPDDEGFLDPRSSARTVLQALDALVEQGTLKAGTVEVEFLRPPTLAQLSHRLQDASRPIHMLHFDGHGTFADVAPPAPDSRTPFKKSVAPQGKLAFEDDQHELHLVEAKRLAEMLNDAGVRVVLLDACQTSRMDERATDNAEQRREQVLSSVATRLLAVGVDAVVAMSASVLVTTTAIFFGELYRRIAGGEAVPTAVERARQTLEADRRRHLYVLRPDEAPHPVELVDWWLPHFYQQRAVNLQPTGKAKKPKPIISRGFAEGQHRPFVGRARELLAIERSLLAGKIAVLHGFGGVGKTRLATEAAHWLTRTGMYRAALFVSFEHGGDATWLLSEVARVYGVPETSSHDLAAAIRQLKPKLRRQPLLIIADNVESLLPDAGADQPASVLAAADRQALWDALLALSEAGAGVVLTTRDTAFGDGRLLQGRFSDVLHVRGLSPTDAYTLATSLLDDLNVSRQRAPVGELRELLTKLDYHPLAMSLTLLALRDPTLTLTTILRDYTALLATFTDPHAPLSLMPDARSPMPDSRNASLLASLEYSLRRLSAEQRDWLLHLAPFEGGAMEQELLAITEIPAAAWRDLRPALEHAALIIPEQVHPAIPAPFLRFHPILVPYLRTIPDSQPADLLRRYAARYAGLARYLYQEDTRNLQPVRALVRRELPNLRRALDLLIEAGDHNAAIEMTTCLDMFYQVFSMTRERTLLNDKIAQLELASDGTLSHAEWLRESTAGEAEFASGNTKIAGERFSRLLERIRANPADERVARGSYEHCFTLHWLARCLEAGGKRDEAEPLLRESLSIIASLIAATPENTNLVRQRGALLTDLGNVLLVQGTFSAARTAYEQALEDAEHVDDPRQQGVVLGQLGTLALMERDYAEAHERYEQARKTFEHLGETASLATIYHQLGMVAEKQRDWPTADSHYRKALALWEQHNIPDKAATTCNQLATVAQMWAKPDEAERWYRRALDYDDIPQPHRASMLNNLASLIKNEVRAGRQPHTRLAEARQLAEQALAMIEPLDSSFGIWRTYSLLADIAELDGRTEAVAGYRRREREAFAAFQGNRWHIDQQYGPLISAIAAAAHGNQQARAAVEEVLPQLEANGWRITDAVRRIWAGERDWHSLCEGIDRQDSLLVLRVLEESEGHRASGIGHREESDGHQASGIGHRRDEVAELVAQLPAALRTALEHGDGEAFGAALAALPGDEAERIVEQLEQAGIIGRRPSPPAPLPSKERGDEVAALVAQLPVAVREALEQQDVAGMHAALAALPESEQQTAMQILLELQQQAMQQITPEQLIAQLPVALREAMARQDGEEAQRIFDALSEQEQAHVAAIIQALQQLQGGG